MALPHFRITNNEFLNKDEYVVQEKAPIIILYSKSDIYMANNGKDTKHTRHISRSMHFVMNGEEWNLHKTVCCEVVMQMADIGTKNVREDELNPRWGYSMIRLEN